MLKKWIRKYWMYFIIIALCVIAITQYEDYLKSHNEALMVLITAVYLFATIRISYANIESAKATVFEDELVFTLTSGEEVRVAPC